VAGPPVSKPPTNRYSPSSANLFVKFARSLTRTLHERPLASTVTPTHRVLRASYLVYFETALSSVRAWSIWSYA
jgi:hypothetical protein